MGGGRPSVPGGKSAEREPPGWPLPAAASMVIMWRLVLLATASISSTEDAVINDQTPPLVYDICGSVRRCVVIIRYGPRGVHIVRSGRATCQQAGPKPPAEGRASAAGGQAGLQPPAGDPRGGKQCEG